MYIYIFAFLLLVSREKSIASPPTRQPRWLRIKIEKREIGSRPTRAYREKRKRDARKKGWKPGSVLQKIARSNESFLLIELITTPSPISFPHIFERNVENGTARCAVNQHRSGNRIESRAKLVIDHRFFPFSFSFFEELQQGKRLSRPWEHGVQRFN